MKLVINTQYKENYGAHDWDGVGECPQYWKFKGGSVYIIENVGVLSDEGVDSLTDRVSGLIQYSDFGSEEYIIDFEVVDDSKVVCEDWEVPYLIQENGYGLFIATRNHDSYSESFVMMPENGRTEYMRFNRFDDLVA